MKEVNEWISFNVIVSQEELDLDNSFFPVELEIELKTGELRSGKVIYQYVDINTEGSYDFGELIDIVESLDLDLYTAIKEKIKEAVFQEVIVITAKYSQEERQQRKKASLLLPLKQWICDSCGETIKNGDGCLKWIERFPNKHIVGVKDSRYSGFQIVHSSEECIGDIDEIDDPYVESIHTLKSYDLTNTVSYLMFLLEENLYFNPQEILETIKRLQTPYYEEGRIYLDIAFKDGTRPDEGEFKYSSRYLKNIIKKYKGIHNLL